LNDNVIEQFSLGATGNPQVLVLVKSARLSPVTVMVESCKAPLPVFLTDTVFASLVTPVTVLENDTLVGERASAGCGGAAPVPFRLIARSATLLLISREAERTPTSVGRNTSEIVQVPFDGIDSAHPFAIANSDALAPLSTNEDSRKATPPELVSVIVLGALNVPLGVLEKLSEDGETASVGTACANTEPGNIKAPKLSARPGKYDS
jgi:hypothetical protein